MSHGVADAALALVGARFRPHGRDPASGLDCVGVVAAATGRAAPSGYALRGGSVEQAAGALEALGFRRAEATRPGDVLLLATGPAQLHLAIRTARGFVHADARLRRVVETPGAPLWPVLAVWRMEL